MARDYIRLDNNKEKSVDEDAPGIGKGLQPVRVLVVVIDRTLRRIVAQELVSDRRVRLIAEVATMHDARRVIAFETFDVMLVDLRLGSIAALELIRLCRDRPTAADVVVIGAAAENEAAALHAFHAGAAGCVMRNSWFVSFVQTVLEVANGNVSLPPALVRRLLHRQDAYAPNGKFAPSQPSAQCLTSLSGREAEVLVKLAQGLRTREIGEHLTISSDTVNAHIKSIYRKLDVHSRVQAVRTASRMGLLG